MTKGESGNHSVGGPSRRLVLQSTATLLSLPLVANTTRAWAQEKIAGGGEVVVFSYGGSFTEGVRRSVYEPFTKSTGIEVVDVVADLAEPQVKAMHQAGRVDWDVAYIEAEAFPAMHKAGMFEPINYSLWDQEALEGAAAYTAQKTRSWGLRPRSCLLTTSASFREAWPSRLGGFLGRQEASGTKGARHSLR
ncbi:MULTISPECIES: hypothetical protein [unclassified Bradyrhizobium]|uniref:hypothetical protein n=1 Tax=unclassified Bradyrhizobium TaxID=2631580 RepID=UPI001CD4010A|nr:MULTISPECIES: hypothetical protein [unclassified Bradyrhizobium]MCA1378625.1 hypothetical protein [Bradyrhizobium sp. IC4060]MCA1488786.1 hypothetical protein [Bradyrhizobium sp. IC4061]